jgi:hypothetical protein
MMHMPELVTPPAVPINARRIVLVVTGLWFVAFVVFLVVLDRLDAHHHRDWLWTSLAGWLLGLLGLLIMSRHRRMGRTV